MYLNRHFYLLALISIIFTFNLVYSIEDATRQYDVKYNPDCSIPECEKADTHGSFNNLIYVKAKGEKDMLHFLYSSIGSFTVMLFKTSLDATMSVNWTQLLSHNAEEMLKSIQFSTSPLEVSGYAFPTVYEFNDLNGDADMTKVPNNQTLWVEHMTSTLIWDKVNISETDNIGTFSGRHAGLNGSFKFSVKYFGKTQRDKDLPHLLINADSSIVDFALDSLDPNFKDSKFGLNAIFLSNYSHVSLDSQRTLDDEYTPGTFRVWNVKVSDSKTNSMQSYFQWKPIFYFSEPRSLENSTITKQYDLKHNHSCPLGIGSAFYNENQYFQAMNVSFGLQGNEKDGYYYIQTNYSAWSFSVGFGEAPVDKMSFIVTLVIFIGFGLPALIILIGLVVMVVKKIQNSRRSEFTPL